MKVEEKLALNKYDLNSTPHIILDKDACKKCDVKPCLYVCPSECFVMREDHVTFSYEGCLECGSCRIACPREAITWAYPAGGFGVCYQYG